MYIYIFIVNIMKKFWFLGALLLVVFVTWCSWWWNKEKAEESAVKNELNIEVCNKYFELVNCIIDNDTDAKYSQQERETIKEAVNDMRDSWANLDDNTASEMCSTELNSLTKKFEWEKMTDYLANIGCSID